MPLCENNCNQYYSLCIWISIKYVEKTALNYSYPNSVISIKEMAELLAVSEDVNLLMELPTEEEKKDFNPMSNSSLDSSALVTIGWNILFDAQTVFLHTVRIIKESKIAI